MGAGGLALLSLCVANSLLSVQCKRCFLALVKPRQSQWMQLNVVKKASIFTMLLSLTLVNLVLMEWLILTKINSITLLKSVFSLPERRFAERMEQREHRIYLFPAGKMDCWKNMMDHQAQWILVKVHLVNKAWSIDMINKTWRTSHKQLGDSHWPWCWLYFLSSAWGNGMQFLESMEMALS